MALGRRLPTGGRIDRSRPIDFSFNGVAYRGFAGDTVASALLASGVALVGRSFKYHRPRGVWGHWVEEPNALVDLTWASGLETNARATTAFLREEGVRAKSVNAKPSAARDWMAWIDLFSPFIPAAFYYKTFMWPNWRLFEPGIRAMAGLGRIDPNWKPERISIQRNLSCDVLVVGAGPAGLEAAQTASLASQSVALVDDRPEPGGSLLFREARIDDLEAAAWVNAAVAAIAKAGGRILSSTTAYGVYDHNLACAVQRHHDGRPDTLWRIRAKHIILASGAIERPLVFNNNDRPGVMSAEAGLAYLRQYGVLVNDRVLVATNNDFAYQTAMALRQAGAEVVVADSRYEAAPMASAQSLGIDIRRGARVTGVDGQAQVERVRLSDGTSADVGALLASGGFTPTAHLFCQSKGRLIWSEQKLALVPDQPLAGMTVVGAANGAFELAAALSEGRAAVGGADCAPRRLGANERFDIAPAWPDAEAKGRAWIDFQNDVTVKDVGIAAREAFSSVELLKRYTTLGMATDQGKTSNVNGIAVLAAKTGRDFKQVGVTTYRPPFTPVSLMAIAGNHLGQMIAPIRRLALEARHRELGATFGEYGGWLRPAHYGDRANDAAAIEAEVKTARNEVAIFDATPLGKIEVMGPEAAALMDFNYYNTMSTLKPGRIRYGFMLQESGTIFDDGVLARLSDDRFVVSCSTSHVAGVYARLDEWRQDQFDPDRVYLHDATSQWVTLTVTGPRSGELIRALPLDVDLSDASLPHMAMAVGTYAGRPVRVARVSFSGDRSYEVSTPVANGQALLRDMLRSGAPLGVKPIGLEALTVLRAEKGYVLVGKDTDGTTMPHDLGLTAPREKRTSEFIGRASLYTRAASAADRKQLVGLEVDGREPLPIGAHAIELRSDKPRSIGFVTSSHFSPTLGRPIAMGLVERGATRLGESVTVQHLGLRLTAQISPICAFDPKGERLNA